MTTHMPIRRLPWTLVVICLMCGLVRAQRFSDWSTPQNLGAVVNSAFNDQHPAVSPDDLALYFVSDRPGGPGGTDIWVTRRNSVDDPWGTPVTLPSSINTAAAEFAPAFGAGGHLLLFGSERPGGCGSRDIWVSFRRDKRDDFAWEAPVNLGCSLNFSGFDDGPTWFEDGESGDLVTIYFTSQNRPGGLGDFDIWASTQNADGSFGPAVNVAELNSPFRDTRTTIRKDGLEMIFTSQRPGGIGTAFDLWTSTRKTTGQAWSEPVNLGPIVNTTFNEGAPALSWSGTTLYLYSNRPGGFGMNDLYLSTREKVQGPKNHD
jgi:hypothetical protein